jgi:hypothetical protein
MGRRLPLKNLNTANRSYNGTQSSVKIHKVRIYKNMPHAVAHIFALKFKYSNTISFTENQGQELELTSVRLASAPAEIRPKYLSNVRQKHYILR